MKRLNLLASADDLLGNPKTPRKTAVTDKETMDVHELRRADLTPIWENSQCRPLNTGFCAVRKTASLWSVWSSETPSPVLPDLFPRMLSSHPKQKKCCRQGLNFREQLSLSGSLLGDEERELGLLKTSGFKKWLNWSQN